MSKRHHNKVKTALNFLDVMTESTKYIWKHY